ncbi:MAG: hypothetical protein HQM16_09050 [Deltaproteobacteria bacterium]|nr:hypothetical protein [Deltaproteobacteria bacterium]
MIQKLLVVALRPEWAHLKQGFRFIKDTDCDCLYHIADHEGVALLQVGIGPKKSGERFCEFLSQHDCLSVLHFGTSGALTHDMRVGDLFFASEVVCGAETIPIKHPQALSLTTFLKDQGVNCFSGRLISVDRPLITPEDKVQAASRFNAQCVDMETISIAELCQKNQIPCISCRGIFDLYNEGLETLGGPFDKKGNISASRLAVNILKEPKRILKIPDLQKRQGIVNRHFKKAVMWFVGQTTE